MSKINMYCGRVNSQGGSKISLLNLITLLSIEDIKIKVFVSGKGWFTDKLDEKNIGYTIIQEPTFINRINRNTNLLVKVLFLFLSIPKLLINWIKISKIINKNDKVVLNETRDIILFLPALLRKNVINIQWIRSEYADKVTRILIRMVDKIIVVTDVVKENIKKLTSKPIYRIHNFMIEKPEKLLVKSINKSTINIAVIGSVQKIKGQLDAVKVLDYLETEKKVVLHIIGRQFDENYTKIVKSYIKDRNLEEKVKFTGHIEDIVNYLNNNVQITLIPSQTESFCRVAMESISVGVPVVAYKVGGLKEVILENKTGILVNKNSIREMADSVDRLLSDSILYSEMSNNGVEDWHKRFYAESIKKQILEILL